MSVEFEFLQKIFDEQNTKDLRDFEIVNFNELDQARLYALYRSFHKKENILLLPGNFLTPAFKPFELRVNQQIKLSEVTGLLTDYGYEKVDQVYTEMQFSIKGDVLIIYTSYNNCVFRIDFFDNTIERILLVDNVSLRQRRPFFKIVILNINPEEAIFTPELYGNYEAVSSQVIIYPTSKFNFDQGLENRSIPILKTLPLFHKNTSVFRQYIAKYTNYSFFYCGHNWELIPQEFKLFSTADESPHHLIKLQLSIQLDKGFVLDDKKTVLLTDREILSTLNLAKAKSKKTSKFKKFFDNEVNIGDYIVHEAHGIGIYKGIETKVVLSEVRDYVIIEYLNNDKLLVPLDQLERLSKFISADNHTPKLTKLGTAEWEFIKRRLKKSVEDIAKELLEIYAKKNLQKGFKFEADNEEQIKFENDFKYQLTEDQIKTLNDVKDDMESQRPMDRLIIGDVGFGKTEIALRAAFKAVQNNKQVIVLAPTTVLVSQLYNVFLTRMSKHKVKISRVSRFDGILKNKDAIAAANEGEINILIGTHRLLSNDVQLKNLGLLIIDEEQRFGVKQKEKIRKLRANVDLLSMSATPIPRTLQMALTGIKDISVIATPPIGRLAVHNEVIFEEEIAEKIKEEFKRKGQAFIVHNEIRDIETFAQKVKQQLPEKIKIKVGHGQMAGEKLEKIMLEFNEREIDVLIATTIIENGIDIPTVNTIIIDNAHEFGLSQLYQLRGRVGRAGVQGYCYLVVPKTKDFIELHKNPNAELKNLHKLLVENKIEDTWITPDAISRIEAILENQELGAGFKIASRDLEIRGSGNILGSEQSGHINAVGYEMYVRLLEQEVDRIRAVQKLED